MRLQPQGGRDGDGPIGFTDHAGDAQRFWPDALDEPWTVYIELEHVVFARPYTAVHEFGHMIGVDHDENMLDLWGSLASIPSDSLMRAEYSHPDPSVYPGTHLSHIYSWIAESTTIHNWLTSPEYVVEERPSP